MDGFSNLMEFSMALAGFTSVVVVFVHKDQNWNEFDKFRVVNALSASLGAGFLSAVPTGLYYLGLEETTIWKVHMSVVCFYIIALLIAVAIRRKVNLSDEERAQLPKKMVGILYLIAIILIILSVLSLFNILSLELKALNYFNIVFLY